MKFTPLEYPFQFQFNGTHRWANFIAWIFSAGLNLACWFYTIRLLSHAIKLGLQ